jgi:hypothetical protein
MRRFTAGDYRRVLVGNMSCQEIQRWIDELLDELRRAPDPLSDEFLDHETFLIVLLDQLDQKIEHEERKLDAMRRASLEAEQDVSILLTSPTDTWTAIREAQPGRFRSRAFAQRLLAESEKRVESEPEEAQALAGFVPFALVWAGEDCPWADELRDRARILQNRAQRLASQHRAIN